MAIVDWPDAIAALRTSLPCSGGALSPVPGGLLVECRPAVHLVKDPASPCLRGVFSGIQRVLAATVPGSGAERRGASERRRPEVVVGQGKLVRDKIPQIIRAKGLEPVIYVADPDEYATRLRDKLTEEVGEFLASDSDPEELAGVLEVVYALAALTGTDPQQLEKLRAAKADERGGFADRIIWSGNQPAAAAGS